MKWIIRFKNNRYFATHKISYLFIYLFIYIKWRMMDRQLPYKLDITIHLFEYYTISVVLN